MSDNKNGFDAEKVVDQIKELVKKGNVSKIIVKHGEDTILNIPLNAGIAGTILGLAAAPWAIITTTIATIGFKCRIELLKDNGEIVEVINPKE